MATTSAPAGSAATTDQRAIGSSLRRGWNGLLRIPLATKLVGANALLVVGFLALFLVHDAGFSDLQLALAMLGGLIASLMVNLTLVHLALRPLHDLEAAATRVWRGDLSARVPTSPLADQDIARVGGAINLLLDRLIADRERARQLAAQVIEAGDRERARIARELHDSTAQTLAALALQVTSALPQATTPEMRTQLEMLRLHALGALEEVRTLSQTIHPRVLDDLGIVPALEWLARRTREDGTDTRVETSVSATKIPRALGSVLYTVAQEAVSNAALHGAPSSIQLVLKADEKTVRLEVIDDGRGFDLGEAKRRRADMGLFAMAERVGLVDGTLQIDTAPGRGTHITATIPMTPSEIP